MWLKCGCSGCLGTMLLVQSYRFAGSTSCDYQIKVLRYLIIQINLITEYIRNFSTVLMQHLTLLFSHLGT